MRPIFLPYVSIADMLTQTLVLRLAFVVEDAHILSCMI